MTPLLWLFACLAVIVCCSLAWYALWLLRQVLSEMRSMNVRLAESLELARRVGSMEERIRHSEERQGQIIHDLNMGLHKVRGEISALSDELVSVGIREASG